MTNSHKCTSVLRQPDIKQQTFSHCLISPSRSISDWSWTGNEIFFNQYTDRLLSLSSNEVWLITSSLQVLQVPYFIMFFPRLPIYLPDSELSDMLATSQGSGYGNHKHKYVYNFVFFPQFITNYLKSRRNVFPLQAKCFFLLFILFLYMEWQNNQASCPMASCRQQQTFSTFLSS